MKVTMAQVNPTVGDLEGNVERCIAAVQDVAPETPDLILFPELVIPGCHPRDILFDPSFIVAVDEATRDFAYRTRSGPPILLGSLHPGEKDRPNHPGLFNAALLLQKGEIHLAAAKQYLPTHDVYHESRWFLPGTPLPPINIANRHIGVLFAHDLVEGGMQIQSEAEILICLAASPFTQGRSPRRTLASRDLDRPVVYLNLCGANDELIYDGRSFALNAQGETIVQMAGFQEDVRTVDLDRAPAITHPVTPSEEELFKALVLGVKDFVMKNRLERAFLGLSGGIDSAVVAIILTEALGPECVTAIAIPSRYSHPESTLTAEQLAQTLGIGFEMVDLEPLHAASEKVLGELLNEGTGAENVQARLRAMILMGYVNRHGGILINASNKTELSLGYATLYGDMAGTLCPIADLTKTEVYSLASWLNRTQKIMPPFILERRPSAELKPDQVDPFDYPEIAPELEQLIKMNRSNFALRTSEHKRWQMGIVLKVNEKSFGSGRMIPITRK